MKKINKSDINLFDTITCGQIFRFWVKEGEYTIILEDRVIILNEDDKYIYIQSSNEDNIEEIVKDFLDLNRNYDEIKKILLDKDNTLKEIIESCEGFKVLNAPSFEMIISYIISANNTVKNIQRCVNTLSEKYGKKIEFNDQIYYLFPTIEELKKLTLEDFAKLANIFIDDLKNENKGKEEK